MSVLLDNLNYSRAFQIKLHSSNETNDVFFFTEDKVLIEEVVEPEKLIGKKVKCLVHFIGFNAAKELVVKIEQMYFKNTVEVIGVDECSDLEGYL